MKRNIKSLFPFFEKKSWMHWMKGQKKAFVSLMLFYSTFLDYSMLSALTKPVLPPGGLEDRQLEAEYNLKKVDPDKKLPLLDIDPPEKELDLGEGTVTLHKFVVVGCQVGCLAKIHELIDPFLHRPLTMKELHELCRLIEQYYAQQDYFLAKAYIPAQEVKESTLEIRIVEGKLGEVSVSNNLFYKKQFIKSYFAGLQNKPLNYRSFLKALLLLNENLDLEVAAIFMKGTEFGTTDVLLKTKDSRPLHLSLDFNNYGSDNTSPHRIGGKLEWGNLIAQGDRFNLLEVVGAPMVNLDFTQAGYQFPLNYKGSFLEFSYLFAHFRTSEIGKNYRLVGRSQIGTGRFKQAWIRTKKTSLDLLASFDYKQIQNFGGGQESSFDRLRVATVGLHGDFLDNWYGRNLLDLNLAAGIPDFLGGMDPVSNQSSRQGSGGKFFKPTLEFRRLQKCFANSVLILNLSGQYSTVKLPLPEQLYIGGIDTVRGYPLGAGLGDQGFILNCEYRLPFPFLGEMKMPFSKRPLAEWIHFLGFFDHGQSYSIGTDKIEEIVPTSANTLTRKAVAQPTFQSLSSAGFGLRIYGPWKFEWSLDWAYPFTKVSTNPPSTLYFRVSLQVL